MRKAIETRLQALETRAAGNADIAPRAPGETLEAYAARCCAVRPGLWESIQRVYGGEGGTDATGT